MLVSTGAVKAWLQLKDGDNSSNSKIEDLIQSVEDFVDHYTSRVLEARTYDNDPEYSHFDGTGTYFMYAKQYPLSHVDEVKVDADRIFGAGTEISTNDIFFYPSGKIVSEGGYFTRGHRNIRVQYNAGYAPIRGGTHDSAVGSYPCPYDITQVIIEMTVKAFKEGAVMIHRVTGGEEGETLAQMLAANSFWRKTLNNYKNYAARVEGYEE